MNYKEEQKLIKLKCFQRMRNERMQLAQNDGLMGTLLPIITLSYRRQLTEPQQSFESPEKLTLYSLQSADTVEKLQIFMDGKFIFDLTDFKIQRTGRDQESMISSDKAAGGLT